LFTGRRVDILDSGSLKFQYSRNRYYDYYTGRFTTHDPLGINPIGFENNPFSILQQYNNGLGLYEYVGGNPTTKSDVYGLKITKFKCCTEAQKQAIQATNDALEKRIPLVLKELQKFTLDWVIRNYVIPEKRDHRNRQQYEMHHRSMVVKFSKMQSHLKKGVGAECETEKNKYCRNASAYVWEILGIYGASIHFCPEFFKPQTHRAEQFLHELSHLAANTTDLGSSWSPSQPWKASWDAYYIMQFYSGDVLRREKLWVWNDLFPKREKK